MNEELKSHLIHYLWLIDQAQEIEKYEMNEYEQALDQTAKDVKELMKKADHI